MPTEYEELKIKVSLVDNASAGLKRLQQQIEESSTGRTAAYTERLQKNLGVSRNLLKDLGAEAGSAGKSFEALATRAGAAGAAIGAVGAALIAAAQRAYGFAKGIRSIGEAAELAGTTFPHMKNIVDQLKKFGIDEQTGQSLVTNVIKAQVEAARLNYSKMFDDLALSLGRKDLAKKLQDTLAAGLPPEETMNKIIAFEKEVGDEIEQNSKGKTRDAIDAEKAQARAHIREALNLADEFELIKKIENLDASRAKYLQDMDDHSKAILENMRTTFFYIDQIKDFFKSAAIDPKVSPFPAMFELAKKSLAAIYKMMDEGEKRMRGKNFWQQITGALTSDNPETEKLIQDYFRNLGKGFPQPDVGTGAGVPLLSTTGGGDLSLGENTRELKKLNDNLYALLHPAGTGGLGAAGNAAADTGTAPPASDYRNLPHTGSPPTAPAMPTAPTTPALPSGGPLGASPGVPSSGVLGPRDPFMPSVQGAPLPKGGGGGDGAGTASSASDIPTNVLAFTRGIARTESGFSRSEAYNDRLNLASNNKNVRLYGSAGADYGFYQMNQRDVDEGIKLGMSPYLAQHLHGGGKGGTSTLDQQTAAVADYLGRKYPNEYKSLIESNNFEGMRKITENKWYGINTGVSKKGKRLGHPADARAEWANVRDAARVSGAALLGGSTSGAGGGMGMASMSDDRVRNTLDGAYAERNKQLLEASGHLKIEVGGNEAAAASDKPLFAPRKYEKQIQMQPADIGPSESSRAAALAG